MTGMDVAIVLNQLFDVFPEKCADYVCIGGLQ